MSEGRASPLWKRLGVRVIGRDAANRLASPFYDAAARRATKRYLHSLPRSGLCVNLGCGPRRLHGWVNVDHARNNAVDVVWDLRRPLPFPRASCTAIVAEHVIEHVSRPDGEQLLRECHRVLEPGGVLRVSTPDAERYLRSYAGDGEFLRHPAFERPVSTPLDRVNLMMREDGQHLWVYDFESLALLFREAGFSGCAESAFGESLHPRMVGIDAPERAFESLYVEATK